MLKLSIRECEKEFGVTRTLLTRKLHDAGVKTGRGIKLSIKEVHEALASIADLNKATQQARLKNWEEEGKLKEIERRLKENEVVLMTEVNELMIKIWDPVARALKDMDAKLAPKCNPTDQVLARVELGKFKRKICTDIKTRCSKLRK